MLLWQSKRPVHSSWLVALLCFGICLGLFVSDSIGIRFSSLQWPVVASLLALFGFLKSRAYILPILLIAGVIVGLWRAALYQNDISPYSAIIGKTVVIQGRVTDDSDSSDRGELVLRLSDIVINGHQVDGALWISSREMAEVQRSDIVSVRGKVTEGFGSFAASMFRAEFVRVQRPVPGDVALAARDWFAEGVRRAVPEPEASLGVGYLVGQRRSLPEELDKSLQTAGLTHIVVASGYNLTILVGVARRLFMKVSKFLATFFSGGLIVGFMAVTGMSPSMSRAGLVTAMGLAAWYYGRRFHPLVLLPVAAAITLLIQPSYAQGDLGWQLSFASFAGVLVVAPLLQHYFFGSKPPGIARQVLFETLSAWVCTVPLMVLIFGQFSNVAIIANLLILPLVPLAMLLTFIAGSVSLAVPVLAVVAGFPASLALGYMTKVTLFLGSLPWAQTTLEVGPPILFFYYTVLIALCGYAWRKTRFNFISQVVE